MNTTTRTLTFVAVAVVSALVAFAAFRSTRPSDLEGFDEVGALMFASFDDPLKATSLTVVDYDDESKASQSFSVNQGDDDLWVIPSHHNYPAEAADRLAKTATSLLGVTRSAVQSLSKDDWKSYGVIDPDSTSTAEAEERGTRVTLRDGSGNALVDLIIGKAVPNRSGFYYVREPEKNPTYIAELNVDLSAKFSDWIEPDLLKINQSDIVEVVVDNYSVDEQRGVILQGERLQFAKEDLKTSGTWKLNDLNDEEEELDTTPVTDITRNLDQLKIVGVRPKPKGLGDDLTVDSNPLVRQILEQEMQQRGFFIAGGPDGKPILVSNEGELIAGTEKGVQYTLYFGEIARGTGKDIEIGLDKDTDDESAEEGSGEVESKDDTPDEEDGPRRYLLVKVGFNEELLGPKPEEPLEPVKPAILEEATDSADESETDEDATEEDACYPFDEEQQDSADESDAKSDEQPASDDSGAETEGEQQTDTQEAPAEGSESESESDEAASSEQENDNTEAESGDENKQETTEPAEPQRDPKEVAQEEYDRALGEYQSQKFAYERDIKSYNDKVEEGKETAEELSTRFRDWYYVISADSFEKFRIQRKDVVSKKEAEEENAETDSSETPDN